MSEMPETSLVEIVMTYAGPDVDNGKMALDDLIPVLQGFGGAYTKLSAQFGQAGQHQLRITGIGQGSTRLLLDILDTIKRNVVDHLDAKQIVDSATEIVKSIFTIIRAKKHTDNKPYTTEINGSSGTINIFNSEKISLVVSPRDFAIFKDGIIDSDLAKMVAPLEPGRVESSEFTLKTADEVTAHESVTLNEKSAFSNDRVNATSTKEVWITAAINSMTKSTNSGYAYLSDGTRVFYKLAGDNPERAYRLFGYRGTLRMRCVAYLDDSLRPVSLDVYDMVPEQHPLELDKDE